MDNVALVNLIKLTNKFKNSTQILVLIKTVLGFYMTVQISIVSTVRVAFHFLKIYALTISKASQQGKTSLDS